MNLEPTNSTAAAIHGAGLGAGPGTAPDEAGPADDGMYHRLGHLTRMLHDALRELGYDQELSDVRANLPDARDRLSYIAKMTGDAAEKVLNAVDRARSVQEETADHARRLRMRWDAVEAFTEGGNPPGSRATPAGAELVQETCAFFAALDKQAEATNAILTDIMLAQDFHDLTGQVIRKVVNLAQTLEEQLIRLLVETTPPELRKKPEPTGLQGPVVNAEGRDDVVTDQAGVDDLLASLGF